MTTTDRDAKALLLDQTYFALDAKGFATFQELLDNPPAATTFDLSTDRAAHCW